MRELVPAWPPGASFSRIAVDRPSDAPYTAAASPAGPPPTMSTSKNGVLECVASPSRSATSAVVGRDSRVPSAKITSGSPLAFVEPAGSLLRARQAADQVPRLAARLGVEPAVRDLIAREEVAKLVRLRRPLTVDHAHALERRLITRLPVAEQLVDHRIEIQLRRMPRLHQVVVELHRVDRADRRIGVGVGRRAGRAWRPEKSAAPARETPRPSCRACAGRREIARPGGSAA